MEAVQLEVKTRDIKVKPKDIRKASRIPAVFYGHNQDNISVDVDYTDFVRLYRSFGESTLIDLSIDEGKTTKKVLIHNIQLDPVTDRVSHIDFINVNMKEDVTTHISLEFVNEAPAIKAFSGNLSIQKEEIEVKCLPQYLVSSIEVDLSPLVDLHSVIHVSDLNVGENLKVLDGPDDVIVTVSAQQAEEVEEVEEEAKEEGSEEAKADEKSE